MKKTERRRRPAAIAGERRGGKEPGPGARRPSYVPALVLCLFLAIAWAFWPVRGADFLNYDDNEYVSQNPIVLGGLSREGIAWAFTNSHAANWHPLTWLSHMLDVTLFGPDPGAHHLVNVAIHAAGSALLLLLLLRLTGAVWRSVLVAALFALHPLHVESVAWVAERKDVLSGLLWWACLGTYLFYVRRPTAARYGLVAGTLALGLMAKPMLVTLPLVLLLLDGWPLGRWGRPFGPGAAPVRSLILEKAPLFLMAGASGAVTYVSQARWGAIQPAERHPLIERLANALNSYLLYLVRTVWPDGLAVYYPYQPGGPAVWRTTVALVVLALVTAAVLRWRRRFPYLAAGWSWYLLTLLPVIGLVQVGGQALADRYTYLPLTGIFIMAAWGTGDLTAAGPRWRRASAVAWAAVVLLLAVAARGQARHWRDNVSLFKHALAVTADNPVAHNNLANALVEREEYEPAFGHYREALRLKPDDPGVRNNLGKLMEKTGRPREAAAYYRQALELQPDHPEALNNLGIILAGEGRTLEALEQFRASLRARPAYAEAHVNLGNVLGLLGRTGEAIESLRQAVRLNPYLAAAHNNLGVYLERLGNLDSALAEYREALRLDPGYTYARENLEAAMAAPGNKDPRTQP